MTRLRSLFLDFMNRSFDGVGLQQYQRRHVFTVSCMLHSKKRSFDGVGHQQYQGRHIFAVYFWTPRNEALMESVISSVKDDTSSQFFLDSMQRSFDGVGYRQYQGRHVFAVYFWFSRIEALMESVISSVKDDTSSQFISGLQETKL